MSLKKAIKRIIARTIKDELRKNDFRVTIFGSARLKPTDPTYKNVFNLAKEIGKHRFDIVTGGGPGIMEAANSGHSAGDPRNLSDDIGLPIHLPWENEANKHLEVKKEFDKFSGRLDTFIALSNIVVIMSGGIGTCLELFYCWQLLQVRHIKPIPIILVGKMWEQLIKWVKAYPLKQGLVSPNDMQFVHIAKNNKQAMEIILKEHRKFKRTKSNNHNYLK